MWSKLSLPPPFVPFRSFFLSPVRVHALPPSQQPTPLGRPEINWQTAQNAKREQPARRISGGPRGKKCSHAERYLAGVQSSPITVISSDILERPGESPTSLARRNPAWKN